MMAIDFIFDFASPNAYLAYEALGALTPDRDSSVRIVPCLLGGIFKATGNQAPMTAFAGIKGKLDYEGLETRRFIARHHLDRFVMNPHFPINSLKAMRGLIAADRDGCGRAYLDAVPKGFWEERLKMDDPEILGQRIQDAGLDGKGLLAATDDPEVKQILADNTQAAVARGVFGVPTFFVGAEMFFGKERLGQVLQEAQKAPV